MVTNRSKLEPLTVAAGFTRMQQPAGTLYDKTKSAKDVRTKLKQNQQEVHLSLGWGWPYWLALTLKVIQGR